MDFTKVGNKIDRGIAILVYSDPGKGKTTCSATLPPGETLFVNVEAGLGPLLGTGHVVFPAVGYDPDWLVDVDKLYEILRTTEHPFKYVVFDNISEYEQKVILGLTEKRGKETPELREYGDSSYRVREIIRLYRDLVLKGITVVFNAWEFPLDIKNDQGGIITKTFPKLGKKIAPEICGIVDVVARLEVHEKSGRRWLRLGPSDQYITKTQFKGLESGEPADMPALLEKIYSYDYGDALEETVEAEVGKLKGGKKK